MPILKLTIYKGVIIIALFSNETLVLNSQQLLFFLTQPLLIVHLLHRSFETFIYPVTKTTIVQSLQSMFQQRRLYWIKIYVHLGKCLVWGISGSLTQQNRVNNESGSKSYFNSFAINTCVKRAKIYFFELFCLVNIFIF